MIRENTFRNAVTNAQDKLDSIRKKLGQLHVTNKSDFKLEFCANEISKEKIDTLVCNLPSSSDNDLDYIYMFKVTGENKNVSTIKKFFSIAKQNQSVNVQEKNDLCRINKNDSKQYFYVGRSHNIKSRMRQHLSENYKGTYALHMERWCTNLNDNIEVLIFQYKGEENMVIQALEDALWDHLKPCFGRKGDK